MILMLYQQDGPYLLVLVSVLFEIICSIWLYSVQGTIINWWKWTWAGWCE